MIAIKNWFMEKNNLRGLRNANLTIKKETKKAVLLICDFGDLSLTEQWIPKSVIIDEWEKDTSGFGYHKYLENVYHKAYDNKEIENFTIKSGRNIYRGDNFIHQLTNKELIKRLENYNITFMSFEDWKNR